MMKLLFITMSIMLLYYFNYKMLIHNFLFILTFMLMMNFYNKNYMNKIYYFLMMDNISLNLIILSFWIIILSMLANYNFLNKKFNFNFILLMMILLILLILCFSSMNLILFYIFFESSLIPVTLIIMGWGLQIDRIQASMYMLFYTLIGSLPYFLILIYFIKIFNNSNMMMLSMFFNNNKFMNFIIFLSILLAFLIKMPMYFTHMWLPKAHVEAPISGSMILAGIMLKLGSYGILRMINMFNLIMMKYNFLLISISLIGSIYSSFICMNQTDLKIIVAYSSVVHMNMMIASLLTLNKWSFLGSFWMMLAHGLCSSCMFYLVNINYERINSRNLFINKSFMNIFPSMSIWWFLICSNNFSAPPSLNLFSEMFMINSIISWLKMNLLFIFIITFLSSYYSLFLFSFSQHGLMITNNMKNLKIKEFWLMKLHWIPLNLIFLNLFIIS